MKEVTVINCRVKHTHLLIFCVTLELISKWTTGCGLFSRRAVTFLMSAMPVWTLHYSPHWHVMSAGWGRNSCCFIFRYHCHYGKHSTSIHYTAFPRPKPAFAPFLTSKSSFAAQMWVQKVVRKVMIVPLVTMRSLGGVYCSLHRFFSLRRVGQHSKHNILKRCQLL